MPNEGPEHATARSSQHWLVLLWLVALIGIAAPIFLLADLVNAREAGGG